LLKRQMAQYRKCKNADSLTFCQISSHPVIVEGWNHYHSIRLDDTVRMIVDSSFYDRWMLSYSIKTGFRQFR